MECRCHQKRADNSAILVDVVVVDDDRNMMCCMGCYYLYYRCLCLIDVAVVVEVV